MLVPVSIMKNYVTNRRDESGAYTYESQEQASGIERQAALQNLSSTYSTAINDAYSSYLNAKRGIQGSSMGAGYKEAYMQQQQQSLLNQAQQLALNAADARQDIYKQESEQLSAIEETKQTEIKNLDKVTASMENYLTYLKELKWEKPKVVNTAEIEARNAEIEQYIAERSSQPNTATLFGKTDLWGKKEIAAYRKANEIAPVYQSSYLSDTQKSKTINDMYDVIYGTSKDIYGTTDLQGNAGLDYLTWVKQQLKTEADVDWFNWLTAGGGYLQHQQATSKGIAK